jgi:hypothetical protein
MVQVVRVTDVRGIAIAIGRFKEGDMETGFFDIY